MKFEAPSVVDLFAGVGGMSLGAARAGFNVHSAVELDERANRTHCVNFPNTAHLQEDVAQLTGEKLLARSSIIRGQLAGLIGGPPCQGFSSIGLRHDADPRNQLFSHFFRLVLETRPTFYLAENVPGILNARNAPILESALNLIPSYYEILPPFTIRASDCGAPTTRTRVFFFGYDRRKMEAVAISDFQPIDAPDTRVRDALAEMPAIRSSWQSEQQSWRSVGVLSDTYFTQRVMDKIPRGVGNEDAISLYNKNRLVSGFLGTRHADATVQRFSLLKPGQADKISKCVRLDRNGYCPTLRAGTGPERGSYQAIRPVHPGSPRVIAPREAARLQGFPDWFQFHPTKWHAFRQIGNSVSPLVAEHILRVAYRALL